MVTCERRERAMEEGMAGVATSAPDFGRRDHPDLQVVSDPAALVGRVPISWSGKPWNLVGLSLLNALLAVVTFGVYSFWGRTEVRRRIWSSVRIHGEPLAYTGTGAELLLGFLIAFGLVLLPISLVTYAAILAFGPQSPAAGFVQLLLYMIILILVGIAVYRARRYRLSRTTWRGIRGTMVGSPLAYGLTSFLTILLYPLTLGWIAPWRAMYLQRWLTRDTRFGNRPLCFEGSSAPLYPRFALLWFGTILLYIGAIAAISLALPDITVRLPGSRLTGRDIAIGLGIAFAALILWSIMSAWYRASLYNHFAHATTFEGARFVLDTTAGGLIWLFVTNYLLNAFTVGILRPVASARSARYFIERLQLVGSVDLHRIAQSEAALDRTGEGLAQAFDVDVI
jgi:uncharacterized membrane protein YjgN (DUF898 family)